MAKKASDERDRPLWATMAQSWLRLAEHADRVNLVPENRAGDADQDNRRSPGLDGEGFHEVKEGRFGPVQILENDKQRPGPR